MMDKLICILRINIQTVFVYVFILGTAIILGGCSSDEKVPEVSGIKIALRTQNMTRDWVAIDTNKIGEGLRRLKTAYPDFLDFYLDTLMGFSIHGNYADTTSGVRIGVKATLTNKDYRGLFDTVAKYYPDTKDVDADLEKGFKYVKYYYPEFKVPRVIYIVSELGNWGAFTLGNDVVGVGLDMFLGDQYPFYKSVGLPDYLNSHLKRSYIPVAVFSAVYEESHPLQLEDRSLLDLMIQKGKEKYFLHKVLPYVPDSTLFGYSQSQLNWCNANEALVYNFFATKDLFYAKEFERIMRYVNDGPNSTGMPAQSPGNIGSWLGYRIVKSYMKQYPQLTMQQMLAAKEDAQKFLENSRYKPR